MFYRDRTLVLGQGQFAEQVRAALVNAAIDCKALQRVDGQQRRIRSARRIILADEHSARAAILAAEVESLGAARGQTRLWLGAALQAPQGHPHSSWRYLCWPRTAARILFQRYPLHFCADAAEPQAAHLLVLGAGALARAVVVQAMRLGHYGNGRLRIDLLCSQPEQEQQAFEQSYPQAHQFCDIAFHPLAGHASLPAGPLAAAYVGLDDDRASLAASARLSSQLQRAGQAATPVFLLLNQGVGEAPQRSWDGRRYPFIALHEVCHPAVLFSDTRDTLARIIHNHYQDSIASQARDTASAPASVSWASLDESYRDASRNQGDHVSAKLALIGCRATTAEALPRDQNHLFTFAPDDVERLAEIEHARWAADRYLAGWTHAEQRDNARKHHPDLVPYAALSEPLKDLDRFAVRLLPALLGRQDLHVQHNLSVLIWLQQTNSDKRHLQQLAGQLMERLLERFPDRQPTLLCRLANAAERELVHRAMDHYGAALRVLFAPGRPLPGAKDSDADQHQSWLTLLSRAEARHALADSQPTPAWLRRRADLLLLDPAAVTALLNGDASQHPRVVQLPAGQQPLRWHFEY